MTYHVVYQLPDGSRIGADIPAANDSIALQTALAAMPAGAVLDVLIDLPEAA